MNTVYWHREIIENDFYKVVNFVEFYESFIVAIKNAKKQPVRPAWELKHDLTGWREYKFFSETEPGNKKSPDMRFVYYYRENKLYILIVGLRNSKETRQSGEHHSIYYLAVERIKRTEVNDWIKIKE
jgi:hypothetical protein